MKKALLLFLLPLSVLLQAQEYEKKSYRALRTDTPPVINGDLGDQAWEKGEWEGGFWQYSPVEGGPVSQQTVFMILYDDNNIYVAVKCFDTAPDSIVSRMTRHDHLDGDEVTVAFDSYFDQRTAFGFSVSAAGVRQDLVWTDDGMAQDKSFDPVWHARTAIHDWGWAAEMRIPLSQLRFADKSEQVWGLEVYRYIYRHDETHMWQPIARSASGMVHNAGLLTGLTEIRPRRLLDMTPFAVARYESYEGEAGNPWHDGSDIRGNIGLDARMGITNNMILSLSLNPDFGQVEADPSEVNLTAFESYFREKRPFFVEGKSITDFNLGLGEGAQGNDNLFYSRRIGRSPRLSHSPGAGQFAYTPSFTPIIGSAKLTGKSSGGLSVGLIEAVTARVSTRIHDPLTDQTTLMTAEPFTNYTVGRVQKDFSGGRTMIGGMVTSTIRALDGTTVDSFHRSATSAAIDFTRYSSGMNFIFRLRSAFSHVTGTSAMIAKTQRSVIHNFLRPGAGYLTYDDTRTSLSGFGGNLMTGKIGGRWQFLYLSAWKSPGFEINDIGYMQVADQYLGVGVINYNIFRPFSVFKSMSLGTNLLHLMDFSGHTNLTGITQSWTANYRNQWRSFISLQVNSDQRDNTFLRGGPTMKTPGQVILGLSIDTDPRKKIDLEVDYKLYRSFDHARTRQNIGFELEYRPSDNLNLEIEPSWSHTTDRMQYVARRTMAGSTGPEDRFIFATINQKIFSISFKADYSLTPDLSIQYWGQPFFGSGEYSEFKRVTIPEAPRFRERYELLGQGQLYYTISERRYTVDENLDSTPDYSFLNPDFRIGEFLHNLVVRWEFRPGSTAYLVWSQNRTHYTGDGFFDFDRQWNDLFGISKPHNIFLIKVSYRFGLH